MIGLDTNILIRYFAQDDAQQSARASAIIEQQISKDNPGFITAIVLVEIVWVLARLYKMPMPDIMVIIKELLNAVDIQIEHHEEAWQAQQLAASGSIDFADALLGAIHRKAGCDYTLTFDKKAATHTLFKAA